MRRHHPNWHSQHFNCNRFVLRIRVDERGTKNVVRTTCNRILFAIATALSSVHFEYEFECATTIRLFMFLHFGIHTTTRRLCTNGLSFHTHTSHRRGTARERANELAWDIFIFASLNPIFSVFVCPRVRVWVRADSEAKATCRQQQLA